MILKRKIPITGKRVALNLLLLIAVNGIAYSQESASQQFLAEVIKWKDPKKTEAAQYLVTNLQGKVYHDNEQLRNFDQLFTIMAEIRKSRQIKNQDFALQSKLDSLVEVYGHPVRNDLEVLCDSSTVTKDFFLENLEYAFKVKSEKAWLRNISDEVFQEYVLPYRVGEERLEEHQRSDLYRTYNFIKKSSKVRQEAFDRLKSTDLLKFASDVQYEISRKISTNGTMWGYPYDIPISKMEQGGQGACRHLVNYTTAAMRSVGLPVASDFCLRWGNTYTGHKWNVLLLENGKELPFDAAKSSMSFDIGDRKIAKVYREQFSRVKSFQVPPTSDVPEDLYSANWKDVTANYIKVVDISVKVPKRVQELKNYVLIGTFNNREWEPQFYAEILKGRATFSRMGVNNVYIAMYMDRDEATTFGDPFKVDSLGRVTYLSPKRKTNDQYVTRKYHRTSWVKDYERSMIGGKFEYANNKDFLDPITVFTVDEVPDSVVAVQLLPGKYRYLRYTFPDSAKVYIAEISLLKNGEAVDIRALDSDVNEGLLKINDRDLNTYYWGKKGQSILYDLSGNADVNTLTFAPRSDSNFIVEGHEYELCYWRNGEWNSLGKQVAFLSRLRYSNVPDAALFVLHNLTKGREERIFTFEKGTQVWW